MKPKSAAPAEAPSEELVEEAETKTEDTKSFTDEDLKKVWDAFKDGRKQKGFYQEAALLNHAYIREEETIRLQIHNPILEIIFDKIKVELLAHLRSELKNNKLKVELEKLETESKKMIYTNKEKFDHLAEQYPTVKLLQEKLGLDPDF